MKDLGYLKPFFTFYGGKWLFAPNYGEPQHNTIIEPFAGSAGYSLNYYEHDVILVEKDPIIYSVWSYLISASSDDVMSLPEIDETTIIRDLDIHPGAKNLIGFLVWSWS